MINKITKEFTKEISKSPGWLPLSFITFWILEPILKNSNLGFVSNHVDALLIGTIATLYLIGEMIDNISFPRNNYGGWEILRRTEAFKTMNLCREKVIERLGFSSGVYQLSKDFASANSKSLGVKYYFNEIINNASKLFRSLVFPSMLIALKHFLDADLIKGVIFVLGGVFLFVFYFVLKTEQMRLYYKYFVIMLSSEFYEKTVFKDKYNKELEMFYWKKKMIHSRLR